MSTPSTNVSHPSATPVDARIAMLKAEMDAATERPIKAALQYEIAHITEHELAQEAQAVREYLGAYNIDPSFHPPLLALVRIFERRRSFKNLIRLYEAESKTSVAAEDRASSLIDRATLLEDHIAPTDPDTAAKLLEQVKPLYEQAIAEFPEGAAIPALFLERLLFAHGDREGALRAIAIRAETVKDPALKGMLLLEVARAKEARGDIDGAIEAARTAATMPAARYRFLEHLERLARRHDRVPELVAALEGRAALAARSARGEESSSDSGAFAVQRFADSARASGDAAALYREAARIRAGRLGDAEGALAALAKAIQLRPDDLALCRDRMLACELAGDLVGAADEARRLLASGAEGRHAAPLHFRIAEEAQSRGDVDGALAALEAALESDGESAVALAMLEDLSLAAGRINEWLERLTARAAKAEGPARARMLWRAAHLAALRSGDTARAQTLYKQALAAAEGDQRAMIAREWMAAALRLSDPQGARDGARAVLAEKIDDEERSAVLRDLHELERMVLDDPAAADAVLNEALNTPAASGWAPDLARLHAAQSGDLDLLSRAHRMLAQRAVDHDAGAAHLIAAARAMVRKGDLQGAKPVLIDALGRVPGHRYAVALLEEVYRALGESEAVVRLLREAGEADRAGKGEVQLLLAGAAAEASHDRALAIQTYEEAADRDPTLLGPLFALRRIAEASYDNELLLKVLGRLSEIELVAGSPGRATLELAEQWQIVERKPETAEAPLRRVLGDASTPSSDLALFAALDLAMLGPTASAAMLDGMRALAGKIESDRSEDTLNTALLRELGGVLLDIHEDAPGAEAIADQILVRDGADPWALLTKLRATFRDPERAADRAAAMLTLADRTNDALVSADLVVHALRAAALQGDSNDDALIRAADLEESLPGSFAAAALGLEALGEADDPGERADAIGRWVPHAAPASAASLRAAQGRALASAGRGPEALAILKDNVSSAPDDLASWDALRVAAREAESWQDVVDACDRLAVALDGELRATLLEEAAATLMDQLEADDEAEKRLRAALEIDGARVIAYGRLHDLLAERADDRALLTLVQARIERTDDPDALIPLYYEFARLHRSLNQRDEALVALGSLLMLDPEHVGGLALLVELHVQREAWRDAVRALRILASAKDVPNSQRRIARLGAADFQEKKLSDPSGALEDLFAIEALGLGDRSLFERMADLGERAQRYDVSVESLAKAAGASRDPAQRATIERRAAKIWEERLRDRHQAVSAYTRALEAVPTDLLAATSLAMLLEPKTRADFSRTYEVSVRKALVPDPTEPDMLRALVAAASWRADRSLETAVLAALVAIDAGTPDELQSLNEDTAVVRRIMPGLSKLSDARLQELLAPGLGGPALELAQLAAETLIEIDRQEPSAWGFGRGDLVNPKQPTPVAQELLGIGAMLGAPPGDVWIGGRDPQLLMAIPSYKGKPAWLAGSGVAAPLVSLRRFEAARWGCALRLGLGPLVARGVEGAATALFAVAAAAGAPLAVGEGRAGISELTRAATKAMSRRSRKAIPEVVAKIGDGGRPILTLVSAAHATFARVGLVFAGDLPTVLGTLLGGAPDRDDVCSDSAALDLFEFWISPAALAARRELGLTS